MDTLDCIATKFDVRKFGKGPVPRETKKKILEAARFTGTGLNIQHWRFILVEKKENLVLLAQDSTSGKWISNADFAVIILTDPQYKFHSLDAGRALQDMQLAGWNLGVASGIFTGIDERKFRKDFGVPGSLYATAILGFGFPVQTHRSGTKSRRPLHELVYSEKYGIAVEV
jgi:nitroreductase